MATTTTVSVNELVSVQNIIYIKPTRLFIRVKDVRPSTKLYVFFNREEVTQYCAQVTFDPLVVRPAYYDTELPPISESELGDYGVLQSTDAGQVDIVFDIPGGTFTTGDKDILVTDTNILSQLDIVNNTYGSASATFHTKGTTQIFQRTTTNTTTYVVPRPVLRDPLGQSFFTFGEKGGIYLTSIGVFFQAKDTTIPVRCEIRKMVNGVPDKLDQTNPDLVATLSPSQVSISDTALVETKFTFPAPVYLPENGEYAFVLFTSSQNYAVWTSRMGERSVETGSVVNQQPYVGSLFKSENNITWTAEQFEDVKFTIYKAQFDTSAAAVVNMGTTIPSRYLSSKAFTTTNGSNLVHVTFPFKHGLQASDYIGISADTAGTYNGIAAASFNGQRLVTEIVDDYTLYFQALGNATSSGSIITGGCIQNLAVINGGSGYTSKPTITIGSSTGTTAIVEADDITMFNGSITSVAIKTANKGSGYTDAAPSVLVSGGGGSGAIILTEVEPKVTVTTNIRTSKLVPQFKYSLTDGTDIQGTMALKDTDYVSMNAVTVQLNHTLNLPAEALLVSPKNEEIRLSSNRSTNLQLSLTSTNPNLSPVVDLRKTPAFQAYTYGLSDISEYEDINSTANYGTVSAIAVTTAGSGYTTATVSFLPAENEVSTSYTMPTATATITSGAISAINVTTAGSGLTQPPLVIISGTGFSIPATATASLTTFNSELNTLGTAKTRYLTKKIRLAMPSTDVRLYSTIYSTPQTSIEVYIRTSLSTDSTKHDDNLWTMLKCDALRNKSKADGELYEYEFYSSGLDAFDTYDLKFVYRSSNPAKTPYVKRYRMIAVA